MSFKKFFNYLNKDDKKIISDECEKIREIASDKSSKDELDRKRKTDSICPKCRSETIVNKISRVQGSVHGSFSLGFGDVDGSTDTNSVNHCNSCGNQWKKYKTNYKSCEDILADWMNHIDIHLDGKYTFGDSDVKMLKEFYAESIWGIFKSVSSDCYISTKENITLSLLRTLFKSIHDK